MLTKSVEIDFSKPLQPLYVDTRYGQIFVVVRWGYLPLGMLRLQCQSVPRTFSVERLQAELLQAFGWRLWEQAVAGSLNTLKGQVEESLPPISVVVCTRDRALSLKRCLQALSQLDYPTYEVVVIDNCSHDPTVAQVVKRSGFRYVREDIPGLDWARNRGIKETKYEIIAYVDDDALATAGWLRGIAHGFEDSEVMAATGMVLSAELETQTQHNFEGYGGMSKGFIGYTIRRSALNDRGLFWASNWGVGANMAFRRSLFEAVGDFNIALDVGTPTNGGGDIEFFYRAVAAGYTLRYEPAAMVYHVHRRDEASLRRQIYNNGCAFAAYLLTIARNEPNRRAVVLRFALRWWIWEWLVKHLFGTLIKREKRWAFRYALTELWGSCSSLWAYRKSQKLVQQLRAKRL